MKTYRPHIALRIAAAIIPLISGLWIWIGVVRILISGDERLTSLSVAWFLLAVVVLLGVLCTILSIRAFLLAVELTPDSIRVHRLLRTRNVKMRDVFDLIEIHNSDGNAAGYALQDKSGRILAKLSVIHNQVEMIEGIKSRIRAVKEETRSANA